VLQPNQKTKMSFEGCECLGLTQRPWQTVL